MRPHSTQPDRVTDSAPEALVSAVPVDYALDLGAAVRNVLLMAVLALTTAAIIYSLFGSVTLMTALSMAVAYAVVVGGPRVGLLCALLVFGLLLAMPRAPAWLIDLGSIEGQALIIEVLACLVVVLLAIAVEMRRQMAAGTRKALMQRLRQAEFVQAVLDGLGSQVFVTLLRPDGTILEVNRSLTQAFGLSRDGLLGLRIEDPDWMEGAAMREALIDARRAAARGETRRLDLRVRGVDGPMWLDCSVGPLYDHGGALRYLVTSALDITERREAEGTQQAIFEAVPTALLLVDRSSRIVEANRQVAELLGYAPSELVGASLEQLLPEKVRGRHQALLEGYFANPSSRVMGGGRDLVAVRADGSTVPVEIGLNPLTVEHGEFVIAAIADISDRRAAQQTLEEAASRLEAEVAARTEELQASHARWVRRSARLQALGRMLDGFPDCRDEQALAELVAEHAPRIFEGVSGVICIEREDEALSCVRWGERADDLGGPGEERPPSGEARHWRLGRGEDAPMVFSMPISSGEGHLGALQCLVPLRADAEAGGSVEEARLLLERVSHNLGMAVTNLRLRRSLEAQATSDSLTHLYNRRYLDTEGTRMVAEARRHGRSLAVLVADIDGFKAINDQYGHDVGDQILRRLAATMRETLRASDLPCRYGGEEFAILLPDTKREQAIECAERLRVAVAAIEQPDPLPSITISAGLALLPDNGEALRELIAAADEAMYRAKRSGRNRVEIA